MRPCTTCAISAPVLASLQVVGVHRMAALGGAPGTDAEYARKASAEYSRAVGELDETPQVVDLWRRLKEDQPKLLMLAQTLQCKAIASGGPQDETAELNATSAIVAMALIPGIQSGDSITLAAGTYEATSEAVACEQAGEYLFEGEKLGRN